MIQDEIRAALRKVDRAVHRMNKLIDQEVRSNPYDQDTRELKTRVRLLEFEFEAFLQRLNANSLHGAMQRNDVRNMLRDLAYTIERMRKILDRQAEYDPDNRNTAKLETLAWLLSLEFGEALYRHTIHYLRCTNFLLRLTFDEAAHLAELVIGRRKTPEETMPQSFRRRLRPIAEQQTLANNNHQNNEQSVA